MWSQNVCSKVLTARLHMLSCIHINSFEGPKGTEYRGRLVNVPVSILEIPASNLDTETGYSDWAVFGFPHSLQANSGIVP
jgi:hypothetical protein